MWIQNRNETLNLSITRVTNKTKPINTAYTIHGHRLESATDYTPKLKHKQASHQTTADNTLPNTAKYVGIDINSKLSCNYHVDAISKKANSTLWFLNRNTAHCSRNVKPYCYKTYVRPQLEYASTVWSPHTKANIDKLEMVQRNAAKTSADIAVLLPWWKNLNGWLWSRDDL